jgi:CRISPR-associated endonuclease/helicase Cas3
LQHAFSGLVTLADWIGSDPSLFPFAEDAQDRMPFARRAAVVAVAALGLDAPGQRAALGGCPGFGTLFEFQPRPAQAAVVDLEVPRGGGLAILEAETGSGKTEAAIARFFALFTSGEVDGMYFALPTRTAATQIHGRVAAAVKRAFPGDEIRPPVVLAVPGYVRVDDVEGTKDDPRLPPFQVLWPDGHAERMRWRGWAAEHPKRYLAGAVVVGTIDQILLSSLPVRHAHLRATSLLRHFLVVDEVHASDAYMNRLLEVVLERHLAAGGHALLMSATLGAVARERFLAGKRADLPSVAEAERLAYPSVAATGARVRRQDVQIRGAGKPKRVEVSARPWMRDAREIAACALDAALRGARVLVLRNTVRGAVETQLAVEERAGDRNDLLFKCRAEPSERDVLAPHHSRFAREDRLRLDAAIEEWLGKDRRSGGCVAVATQTVQQSLDLDADLLLTDLCPADVLLQRIGRLHRHGHRPRPPGFERARALLLVPEDRDLGQFIRARGAASGPHGIGTVYADLRVLEATWRLAEGDGPWRIPEMNRLLVERTTHPEALRQLVEQLGGNWVDHATAVAGAGAAKTALAAVNAFDWRLPFGERGFDAATDARVSTRLGAGDRIARFATPITSPFGGRISALTLPSWLVSGADEDAEAVTVAMSVGSVRFRFGTREYLYDRLGLRRGTSEPKDHEEDRADA